MAAITDKLFELEATLESMVTTSGDAIPKKGELSDIVSHLDYIIELLGTMVSAETYEEVKEKQTKGFNGIYDRTDTINELLKSGEISGDVDLYPLTITENGTYSAGAGKGYSRIVAVVDSGADLDIEDGLVTRTLTSYTNSRITSIGDYAFAGCSSLTTVSFPECTSIGVSAFANCYSLNSVYLNRSSIVTISRAVSTIFQTYSTITYYVPASLVDTYKSAQYWSAVSSRFSTHDFSD